MTRNQQAWIGAAVAIALLAIGICRPWRQSFVEAQAVYEDEVRKMTALEGELDRAIQDGVRKGSEADMAYAEAQNRGEKNLPPLADFDKIRAEINARFKDRLEAQRERVRKAEEAKEVAKR